MFPSHDQPTPSRRWSVLVVLLTAVWILSLSLGLPVPTPLEAVATPIGDWALFATDSTGAADRPETDATVAAELMETAPDTLVDAPSSTEHVEVATVTARPAGAAEQSDVPEDVRVAEPDAEPARASAPVEVKPMPSTLSASASIVRFGPSENKTPSDDGGEPQEDGEEPEPAPPSPTERLLNIVAAGQRLIDGDRRVPAMSAKYSVATLEEFIRQGWFYVLAVVPDVGSTRPRVYMLRPDPAEPLRRGEFVLADSAFLVSRVSQLALPVSLSELHQLFRLQVGEYAGLTIRVRARTDVARYIWGKQFGAFEEVGLPYRQVERAPLFTDGVLLVGRGRPVYRITVLQVGNQVLPWTDPEGGVP